MDEYWIVDVKGGPGKPSWEISVLMSDNHHGIASYGWFDENKLLVSHNGGPCHWPICQFVWDQQLLIAEELCRRLNAGESIDE